MNIAITGGLGFQGTNLSKELLLLGHKVFAINTPSKDALAHHKWLQTTLPSKQFNNLVPIWTSITDTQTLERIMPQVDVIYHLAAKINVDESIGRPDVFYETNIRGTYNILNLAIKNNTRVIMASTCEVYGGGEALDEDSPLLPKSPYAASKASADRIAFVYNQTYGLPVDIVRPFNVYGPLQKEGGQGAVIAIFFHKIMNGEDINIHGDGKQGRDFIYVDDVIRGYIGILNTPNMNKCNIYTFGTGVSTSVNEIAEHIIDITGMKGKTRINYIEGRKGQVTTFIAKKSVKTYFGGEDMVNIRTGLENYYNFRFKKGE